MSIFKLEYEIDKLPPVHLTCYKKVDKGIVRKITNDIIDVVIEYDESFFPDDRKTFIKNWIQQDKTIGIVFLDSETQDLNKSHVQGIVTLKLNQGRQRLFF